MISYRSPYVETVYSHGGTTLRSQRSTHMSRNPSSKDPIARQSQAQSRYSEPVSPGTRPDSGLPPPGFQYGSGPIPSEGQPFYHRSTGAIGTNAAGIDPVWLDKLLTKAVKQGVELSRQDGEPPKAHGEHKQRIPDEETVSQPPGAWPLSPFAPVAQPYQQSVPASPRPRIGNDGLKTHCDQSQDGWGNEQSRGRRETHVSWNAEQVWKNEVNDNEWGSHEDTPDDSWDTDETWTTKKSKDHDASRRRQRSIANTALSHSGSRPQCPYTVHEHNRSRSGENRSWKSRSKSRPRRSRQEDELKTSSEDNEGWTHIEAKSDSGDSWNNSVDSIQPSRRCSRSHTSRIRRKSSSHPKTAHSGFERRPSRRNHSAPTWDSAPANVEPIPPVITQVPPNVVNSPASIYPLQPSVVQSKKASAYSEPAISVFPTPSWSHAAPEKVRMNSYASKYTLPAPYAATVNNFEHGTVGDDRDETQRISSSSWGSGEKEFSAPKPSGGKAGMKNCWKGNDDNGWGKSNSKADEAGWETTENGPIDTWSPTSDVKDVHTTAWTSKGDAWDSKETPKKRKDKYSSVDAWEVKKTDRNTTNDAYVPWQQQGNTLNNQDNHKKAHDVPWNTDNHRLTTEEPATAGSTSKRHTKKSLSKYRQLRSVSLDVTPKSHWQFPPVPSKYNLLPLDEDHESPKVSYIAPKEPLYKISKQTASEKGIEHQVRAGKGMLYGHVIGRPEYLDQFDKPVSDISSFHLGTDTSGRVYNILTKSTVRSIPLQIPQPLHTEIHIWLRNPRPRPPHAGNS